MKKHPNILMIMSDDQGAWAMHCAGNDELITPNLDRLAVEGMRFENFFCVSPVCSPARASLLTGRIPSNHGVHDWLCKGNFDDPNGELRRRGADHAIEYLHGISSYSDFLSRAGYDCALCGKWHMGDSARKQKSFNYWYALGGGTYRDYVVGDGGNGVLKQESNYLTTQLTDKALDFLGRQQFSEHPFYLSLHYTAPHAPWGKKHHPEDIWKLYDECEFKSTPDMPLHPWQCRFFERDNYDRQKRREFLQGYFTAISAMDFEIGRVLDHLEETGERENTIIVFTSDNGMNMGHHGIWGKGNGTFPLNMYDSSVKIPFIISWPGHVAQSTINSSMYSHYDVFPTLLDFLDIENPLADELPGRSFAPLLRGQHDKGRENIVIHDEYGPVRMIRSRDWKYVHRYPYGPHELYKLCNDPNEDHNLIAELEYADIADKLRGQLNKWFARYADPARDGCKEAVTGDGQCALCGSTANGKWCFYQSGSEFPDYEPLAQRYFNQH